MRCTDVDPRTIENARRLSAVYDIAAGRARSAEWYGLDVEAAQQEADDAFRRAVDFIDSHGLTARVDACDPRVPAVANARRRRHIERAVAARHR